ncbi:hypothetical protein [Streptosporangium canum]|uniref:hypothetical protein n=1 Tax=Streptosporangium canum TaxID=324952 RepID=UPI0037AE4C7A
MSEITTDELYSRACRWGEQEETVRANLERMGAPAWTVPYRLHPSYDSYGFGAAVLGRASRTCPSLDREEAWEGATRLSMAIGRNALGGDSWADGYVGTPLLAARVAAASFLLYLREDLGHEQALFSSALGDYVAALWPQPERARPAGNVTQAMALHRQLHQCGVYEQVPGLQKLIAAGLDTAGARYSACIGHLLRQVIHDPSHVRRDLHGRVLEELLTGG